MQTRRHGLLSTPLRSWRPVSVGYATFASAYRPRAIRTNWLEEPETLEARAPLIELQAIGSPSNASTAAWMSLARIGSSRSANTRTTALTTQPGRRDRSRWRLGVLGWASATRTPASFLARWANDSWTSWFDRTPIAPMQPDSMRTAAAGVVRIGRRMELPGLRGCPRHNCARYVPTRVVISQSWSDPHIA
jgi:hypothetical protein